MTGSRSSRYFTYIKPVVENRYIKSAAPSVFSLITITIFIVFAIRPTVSVILGLQKNIANQKEILVKLNEKAQNLSQGKKNWESLGDENRLKINTAVPAHPEIPLLIKALKMSTPQTASFSALQIQPLTIIDVASSQSANLTLAEISFAYNIQGSYQELLSIIQNLEKSPRLLHIDSLSLNKQSGELTLSLNGKAYYLK